MKGWLITILLLLGTTAGYSWWALHRPLPKLHATIETQTGIDKAGVESVTWSAYGQQAVGITGQGVVATSGVQKTAPMASVAKVMLALAVLQKKPLEKGESGPNITVTAADVANYQQYLASAQSVVPVQVGENLSEYQALQALMLPSANNIATLLANWAFGSLSAYTTYADEQAKQLGMVNTHFADASGFSAATVSSASDLVVLGIAAMKNPVIAEIVAQSTATIPVAGLIHNYNLALGKSGINGIKTGNTDEAGGCLLFSTSLDGTTLVAAIMGAPDRGTAIHDAPGIASSFSSSLKNQKVLTAGQVFAHYSVPWGADVDASVRKDLSILSWKGTTFNIKTQTNDIDAKSKAGDITGSSAFTYKDKTYSSELTLTKDIPTPSAWWKLTHPLSK